ncbi:hypothetical protein B1690_14040 [Geobacillus sp. 46C-IIa]|nr:hypothetical protein B1690_14040 [Geobacillus sp. 46C-IIa]
MELLKDSARRPTISIAIVVCPWMEKLSFHADPVFMGHRVGATAIRFMDERFERMTSDVDEEH